jgi:hypothetical protein
LRSETGQDFFATWGLTHEIRQEFFVAWGLTHEIVQEFFVTWGLRSGIVQEFLVAWGISRKKTKVTVITGNIFCPRRLPQGLTATEQMDKIHGMTREYSFYLHREKISLLSRK